MIESQDHYLLTRRPAGSHLAGLWEFPGGKCLPHETHAEALRRELHEELDIVGRIGDCIFSVTHDYPDRPIELHFYACGYDGEPKPMMGQQMRWVKRHELRTLRFPAADAELIDRLADGGPSSAS